MTNEEYLALVEKLKTEQEIIELPMPSGAIWKHTPIDLMPYLANDRLPTNLARKLRASQNGQANPPNVSPEELEEIGMKALTLVRDIMLNNLVFPKISLEPKEGYILPEQLHPPDFKYFSEYVLQGAQANQPNTFRQSVNRKRR